ncbi:hypothetical protein [Marinovum algicola]|uniref:AraC-like ligand-binding domain-containing protein n=1 Tax=Marinovum algicola TaxID=42444 RepID=UPI0032EC57AA
MRDILTRLTNTDEIDVIGKGHEIDASLRCADLGGLSIMHVTYGDVPTRVHAYEHDEDTLLLFILTGGAAGVRHCGDDFEISTHTGLMRDKRQPLTALDAVGIHCFGGGARAMPGRPSGRLPRVAVSGSPPPWRSRRRRRR